VALLYARGKRLIEAAGGLLFIGFGARLAADR